MSAKQKKGFGMGGHQGPMQKDEWLTPPWITGTLAPFDLDPCAPREDRRPWTTAAAHYSKEMNGLVQPWYGMVWMNPPYGKETEVWLERLSAHGKGIALIFARTETVAWRKHVWDKATAILFLYGRLKFHHVDGTASTSSSGAPSALVAYGEEAAARLKRLRKNGKLIELAPTEHTQIELGI